VLLALLFVCLSLVWSMLPSADPISQNRKSSKKKADKQSESDLLDVAG